ncbi:MAG: class I SAM-dependent methyltransferase [Bacteroidales bacterium]|nr:class I SAM-dependent methyltransferase [Bacteroidales bacterium]
MDIKKINKNQVDYYGDLFEKYSGTPMAVSSESEAHKKMRFEKIAAFIEKGVDTSLHDIGMGVGSFYEYLKDQNGFNNLKYSGSDILEEYVRTAQKKYPECDFYLRDIADKKIDESYDYVIMSGVFHQRRDVGINEWLWFSRELIRNAFSMANKSLVVNFVSGYVDYYQPNIYYCDLMRFINFVFEELSRFFVVDHCYPLYEFTVCISKEKHIMKKYPQKEFTKYFSNAK